MTSVLFESMATCQAFYLTCQTDFIFSALAGWHFHLWHIILMSLLLCCSAFFSGTETAFSNLSPRQISSLHKSANKFQRLAGQLLNSPKKLIGSLLLGNMAVNVLFFALASVLTVNISSQFGPMAAAVVAFLALAVLVLFGEIIPKSLAYSNSKRIALATALPVFVCVQFLKPLQFIFNFFIVAPALRLLLGPPKKPEAITTNQLKLLIESSRRIGLISADENQLLAEVLEFGLLKVRHVTRPRVDMIACDIAAGTDKAKELMAKHNLTKLPVFSGRIDNILGLVHLRRLLLEKTSSLDKLTEQVHFVPEQKSLESLLEFFRKTRIDTAIVVDEYGGVAGIVSLEDIVAELLGPLEPTGSTEPIEPIGPLEYRLAGNLAIHDWAEAFGIDPIESRLSTIGGLATALLGRIPRSGDVAYLRNLKFTIERVKKHRVESLILSLQPISENRSSRKRDSDLL